MTALIDPPSARQTVLRALFPLIAEHMPDVPAPRYSEPSGLDDADQLAPLVELPVDVAERYATVLGLPVETVQAIEWRQSRRGAALGNYVERNYFVTLFNRPPKHLSGARWGEGLRLGLFFMKHSTAYPMHSHAAHELYFLLDGACTWSIGGRGEPVQVHGPEVKLTSWLPHGLETGSSDALMAYAWWGDSRFDQYKVEP